MPEYVDGLMQNCSTRYLQCISNGDAAILQQTIDIGVSAHSAWYETRNWTWFSVVQVIACQPG